jgi:hypothetical protein
VPEHHACPRQDPAPMPAIGTFMVDTRTPAIRAGRVMAHEGATVFLRPPGGGIEWTAPAEALREPTDGERASIRALTTPVTTKGGP